MRSLVLAASMFVAMPSAAQEPDSAKPAQPPAQQRTAPTDAAAPRDGTALAALGWQLGVQAWTFRDRTAFEAIDTVRALGLDHIELYPGQPLSPAQREVKVGPDMAAEQVAALQQKLARAKVQPMAFGVAALSNDEAAARKLFAFCKALGVPEITTEPEPDAFALADKLCAEYGIRIGVHEHAKPNRYWKPEIVLQAIAGRSEHIGFCADVGHWTRSGLDPVQCLREAKGHIVSLHLKDTSAKTKQDVPFGEGDCHVRELLAELQRQGFRGLLSIEHETGAGAAVERDVAAAIAFVDAAARELAAAARKGGAAATGNGNGDGGKR